MSVARTLLALSASFAFSASALAADQYIFGFSDSNAGNGLTINGTTTLRMADQGWYSQAGNHTPSNPNYLVGLCTSSACGDPGEVRNWFAFDISGLSNPVSSLALRLYSYSVTLTSGNYYLNDVTTPVASLTGGTGGLAAWNDLGSGTNFGFRFYQSATDSNQYFDIALNGAAIASLNSAIAGGESRWAIGGAFAAGTVPLPPEQGPSPIPLPPSAALLLGGLVAMRLVVKRKA